MSSKNHRLLIMGPRRDIVCEMMAQLDEVSQDVPEGFYLQFCGHLMRLHELSEPPRGGTTIVQDLFGDPPPQRPRVRRGIPARIRTEAERQADPEDRRADRAAQDQIYRDLFGDDVEYRPTSPARHPRRL
jgi:hypothetical protein